MHGPRDKIGRATKLPTRESDLTGRRNAQNFLGANSALRRAYPEGGFDAHSGLGNFGDRDDFNRASGGPDVRSGLSGLPSRVGTGQLLRMQLHVTASVQRVGVRARGTVRHQSIFRERAGARGLSPPSARLLEL